MKAACSTLNKVCIFGSFSARFRYITNETVGRLDIAGFTSVFKRGVYVEESSHLNANAAIRRW